MVLVTTDGEKAQLSGLTGLYSEALSHPLALEAHRYPLSTQAGVGKDMKVYMSLKSLK